MPLCDMFSQKTYVQGKGLSRPEYLCTFAVKVCPAQPPGAFSRTGSPCSRRGLVDLSQPFKALTLDPIRINGNGVHIFLSLDSVGNYSQQRSTSEQIESTLSRLTVF